MDKLQVLVDADGGPPDFRRQFVAPVVVPGDALAITGQVQGGPVFPVGAEHGADAPAVALRPQMEGEDRIARWIPRAARRRLLRVSSSTSPPSRATSGPSRGAADWKELAVSAAEVSKTVSALRGLLKFHTAKPFDTQASFELYQKS